MHSELHVCMQHMIHAVLTPRTQRQTAIGLLCFGTSHGTIVKRVLSLLER